MEPKDFVTNLIAHVNENEQMNLDQDKVPSTIASAVQILVDSLSDNDRKVVQSTDVNEHHFPLGMGLRNNWTLWAADSPLKRDAVNTYGIAHADDISGLILAWAFALARQEPFDPQVHCQVYHDHWKQYELTSLEAGGGNRQAGGRAYYGCRCFDSIAAMLSAQLVASATGTTFAPRSINITFARLAVNSCSGEASLTRMLRSTSLST